MRVKGDRHDSAFLRLQRVPDGRPVDITVNDYTLVTAGGQLRLRPELTLFLHIDNLTDAAYDGAPAIWACRARSWPVTASTSAAERARHRRCGSRQPPRGNAN